MLFENEEAQHEFHKLPALLQAVCQILETYLAAHGVQIQYIDSERHAGLWCATVGTTTEMEYDALIDVLERVNKQFARTDEIPTCELESDEYGLISVRVSESQDLANLI